VFPPEAFAIDLAAMVDFLRAIGMALT